MRHALSRAHADAEQARALAAAADATTADARHEPAAAGARAWRPACAVRSRAAGAGAGAGAGGGPSDPATTPSAAATIAAPPAASEPAEPATAAPGVTALRIDPNEHELAAHDYFRREYDHDARALGTDPLVDPVALPAVSDHHGHVVAEHRPGTPGPSVDVVVCVHNALDDVRTCLWSVVHKTDRPFRLILVNDGSDEDTTAYLEQVAADVPHDPAHPPRPRAARLHDRRQPRPARRHRRLRRPPQQRHDRHPRLARPDRRLRRVGPEHRHPRAALQRGQPPVGPRAARRCGLGDQPAAARSRRPTRSPSCSSASRRASARASPSSTASATSIKRAVIDAIGVLRRGELRQRLLRGERLLLPRRRRPASSSPSSTTPTSSTPSRSPSASETRKVIAKRNYEIFLEKHGRDAIQKRWSRAWRQNTRPRAAAREGQRRALLALRARGRARQRQPRGARASMFVLPGLGDGGSGGSHSIYQEVLGMRALGLDARIALRAKAIGRARAAYDDADEVFVPYRDDDELRARHRAGRRDRRHPLQVRGPRRRAAGAARRLPARLLRAGLRAVLHVARLGGRQARRSRATRSMPGCLLFAKTHWLCNIVAAGTACTSPRSSRASTSSSTARTGRAAPAGRCGSARWCGRAPRAASRPPRSRCSSSSASSAAPTSRSRRSAAPRPSSSA